LFHIVLYQPEIPPNTGNVIRLCANTGCSLHLIKPLGFQLTDKAMKRAGLDYERNVSITTYEDWASCRRSLNREAGEMPGIYAFTTRASRSYSEGVFRRGDVLLFGPETRGLPTEVLEELPETSRLRLPMREGSRSLNLSNTVAVAVYEGWRQCGFPDAV
jgi:tRNA (cytidine/uridine-2'-O-)-methyltransferase